MTEKFVRKQNEKKNQTITFRSCFLLAVSFLSNILRFQNEWQNLKWKSVWCERNVWTPHKSGCDYVESSRDNQLSTNNVLHE